MKKRKKAPIPDTSDAATMRARIEKIEADAKAAGVSIVIKQNPGRKRKKVRATFAPGSFSEVFVARLEKIDSDAKAVGANLTIVCKLAKISRAGPVRWNINVPLTIKTVDKMERALKKLTEKYNKARAEGANTAD